MDTPGKTLAPGNITRAGDALRGRGLHGGRAAAVCFRPAGPGAGLTFVREDLGPRARIPVSLDSAEPRPRHTCLRAGGVRVATVEHVLSALHGLSIVDGEVWVDGPEVPILDGSARLLLAALRPLVDYPRRAVGMAWSMTGPVHGVDGAGECWLVPAPELELACVIEHDHPAIGRHALRLRRGDLGADGTYARRIAPARTFGLLRRRVRLRAAGFARGATLGSVLVYGAHGPINPGGTRFHDEPVRHKLLDALGDLWLLGAPLRARVVLRRCSHRLLVRTLQRARARGLLQRATVTARPPRVGP